MKKGESKGGGDVNAFQGTNGVVGFHEPMAMRRKLDAHGIKPTRVLNGDIGRIFLGGSFHLVKGTSNNPSGGIVWFKEQ